MNASDSQDRSSRVEREVLEILERAEAAQTPVDNLQATVRRQRATVRGRVSHATVDPRLRSLLSGGVARIAGALLLAVLAAAIADASRLLAVGLAIASAVLFFSLWVPTPGAASGDSPRWRGQDLKDRGAPPPYGRDRDGPPS